MNVMTNNLLKALFLSWSADTSFLASEWSKNNPARGQCVVSALVVQDYLGGELIRYHVKGDGIDEMHYVNSLEHGVTLDTTASQYKEGTVLTLTHVDLAGFKTIRDKRLSDADTYRRYKILKQRVETELTLLQ